MREISCEDFAARYVDGDALLDVREPMEYIDGHVPGAELVPMSQITLHTKDVPRDRPVYVICATGNRSLAVTTFLARAGVDAWSVGGGTAAWSRLGKPLVRGMRPRAVAS